MEPTKKPRASPTCSTCGQKGHTSASTNCPLKPNPPPPVDNYTKDVLIEFFNVHKKYTLDLKKIKAHTGVDVRGPNMPEHISENLIKFVIQKTDSTSRWNCKSGDLYSTTEGKQECKCFTSDGPPSFTPSSEWDVIYFLDARNWLEDKFILHRVALKKSSPEWRGVKVSKKETFGDQADATRRPRITWDFLYPQIKDHCTTVFEGSFDEIFKTAEGPVAEQSA